MTPEFFRERFPAIHGLCLEQGIDPPEESIPVVPAAHYSCGGVVSDRSGKTAMAGLLVAGEVAHTGIHGANRLASNSLLEALVLSHRSAQTAIEELDSTTQANPVLPDWVRLWKGESEIEQVRVQHCKGEVQRLMWDYVGIVRKTDRLELSRDRLALLQNEVEAYVRAGEVTPSIIELRNMVQTSILVVHSALSRHESRGLHFTLDYPETHKNEAHDTLLTRERID